MSDLSSFTPRYVGTGQGGNIVVNIKLTFGLSVVKMKARRHRFCIADL